MGTLIYIIPDGIIHLFQLTNTKQLTVLQQGLKT